MSEAIRGPGILWVQSRVSPTSKDILDETTFLKWYDDEHITEVVSTSGIRSGFRYIDVKKTSPCGNPANPTPFLAFYPLEDLAFTLGDEFKKINIKSIHLPGSGIIYDMADFDISSMAYLNSTPRKIKGEPKYLLSSGIRTEKESELDGIDEYYNKQIDDVSREKGYIRTLRFRLLYARTNAQSRALKGLPTTEEPYPEPSTWLAVHEFSETPGSVVVASLEQDLSETAKKHGWGKTQSEVHVWSLEKVHGEGKFFE
ncbi:hypothetical protein BKA66DRAFT_474924 [Pyrenochaeta sp. MPI-SDFR-AT-0127]|nr:hypothetical protein BKA66DRAFT_474924 [Pyrenochaeta sp. MPI-SDFR-AT-0127]